jgi:hypothetical protein
MIKSLFFICLLTSNLSFAQGKFAGGFTSLIKKNYKYETELPLLKGFTRSNESLLSNADDSQQFGASVYVKGNIVVALFEQLNIDKSRVVLDVLEVKNVLPKQEVTIGQCQDGASYNVGFVALVQVTQEERWKAIKAWYFNRDKIRLEAYDAAKVTCIGMVGDD